MLFSQNLNWMDQISGTGFDRIIGMKTDASGNIYVVGSFTQTIDLDPGPGVVSKTAIASDIWMAKYTSGGALVWGNHLSGGGDDVGLDIALDNSGNVYITGYIVSTLPSFDFDPSAGSFQPGVTAGFFAKYTNNGGFVWAKVLSGGGTVGVNSIAVDASANIYIAGTMSSGVSVDFDPGSGTQTRNAANGQIFYAKYNSSGGYVWAKNTGAPSGNQCWDLALDGSNNLTITGLFFGTTDFNPDGTSTNYTNTNGSAYLAKYNSSGTFQWAKTLSGSAGDWGKRCAADGSNNIYVTGKKAASNGEIFLIKYSSSGTVLWSWVIAGTNSDEGQDLVVEGTSSVYISGYFTGTGGSINFNPLGPPNSLTLPANDNDFFIGKYNASNGNATWIRNLDLTLVVPTFEVNGMGISGGNIVMAGNFRGSGDFNSCGASANYNATTIDAFIATFNASSSVPTINGPSTVCSTGSFAFTLTNSPPGATINWSVTPANLVNPSTGTGTSFSTNAANANSNGAITVTATVTGTCGVVASRPAVWVGRPSFSNTTVDDNTYIIGSCHGACPGYHWAEMTMQGITPAEVTWTLTPGGTVNWQWEPNNNQIVFEVIPFYTSFPFYFTPSGNVCGPSTFQFCFISGSNCPQGFAYYPNPANEELVVMRTNEDKSIAAPVDSEISLYSASMEELYSVTTNESTVRIPVLKYPEGRYYLKISNTEGVVMEKILIQR